MTSGDQAAGQHSASLYFRWTFCLALLDLQVSVYGGYLITSKVNGISLFFAASGLYSNAKLARAGDEGCYWSSSPHDDLAYALQYFVNENITTYYLNRSLGFSVRPVKAAAGSGS